MVALTAPLINSENYIIELLLQLYSVILVLWKKPDVDELELPAFKDIIK